MHLQQQHKGVFLCPTPKRIMKNREWSNRHTHTHKQRIKPAAAHGRRLLESAGSCNTHIHTRTNTPSKHKVNAKTWRAYKNVDAADDAAVSRCVFSTSLYFWDTFLLLFFQTTQNQRSYFFMIKVFFAGRGNRDNKPTHTHTHEHMYISNYWVKQTLELCEWVFVDKNEQGRLAVVVCVCERERET